MATKGRLKFFPSFHHIPCHVVHRVKESCKSMSQADAGERGLPALTSDAEEGFENSLGKRKSLTITPAANANGSVSLE